MRRKNECYVTEVLPCTWKQRPSTEAFKLVDIVTLCGPFRDGVFAAKASDIVSKSFANLAVETDQQSLLTPYRLILLVKGTTKSKLEKASADPEGRIVSSESASCLLSSPATDVNLRGYATEMDLLDYKLDKDTAVVVVSNVMKDSASKVWLCIEHLTKIHADDVQEVIASLKVEYQMASTTRHEIDRKRAVALLGPDNIKRARTLGCYPSDPP